MVNPLRLPLVLIGILLGLCYFVHTQSVSKSPILEEAKAVDDSIRLRKAGDVYLTTNVRDLEKSDVDDKPTLAILPEVQDGAPVRAASEPFPTGKRQLSPLPPVGQLPSVLASKGPAMDQAESRTQVDNSGSDALPRFLPTRSARQAPLMHRIVDGDDLRDLAARYLGNENRYLEIFEANREILVRPDLLPLGVKIRIPTSH